MMIALLPLLVYGVSGSRVKTSDDMDTDGTLISQEFYHKCEPESVQPQDGLWFWDPNVVTLEARYFGNDAWAIFPDGQEIGTARGLALPTNGGFIVTKEGVIVVEAYINYRLACQARALIQKHAGNNPIKYVVWTSKHGDHNFGAAVFNSSNVPVTYGMHWKTKEALDDERTYWHLLHEQTNFFGTKAGIADTKPITEPFVVNEGKGDLVIELGGDKLVGKTFGMLQNEGDLLFWHDKSGLMYTGNPIVAAFPAVPWLLDGELARSLQAYETMLAWLQPLSDRAIIIPGHGAATNIAAVNNHKDYVKRLIDWARSDEVRGMNKDKAVEHGMSKFGVQGWSGYQGYGAVSSYFNLPYAYVEFAGKMENGEVCTNQCPAEREDCIACRSGFCDFGDRTYGNPGTCAPKPTAE